MYRIGQIAELVGVTPDTIRYYEQQKMMSHNNRTEGGFRLYDDNDLQRLKFIRHARELDFTLGAIRELLSIRIDPEHHTCKESKDIVEFRLMEIETRIRELKKCSNHLSGCTMHAAEHLIVAFIVLSSKRWSRVVKELNHEL